MITTRLILVISSKLKPHASSPKLPQLTVFRWTPVASYDNSQSEIDVMFEYKYVSIPTGILYWPTNSFATICEKCTFKNQSYFTYSVPILSLLLFCVCVRHSEYHPQRYTVGTSWSEEMSSGSDISVTVEETMQVFHDHWYFLFSHPMNLILAQLQSLQPQLKDVRRQASGRSSVLSLVSLQGISSMLYMY